MEFQWQDKSGRYKWDLDRSWLIEEGQETVVPVPRHLETRLSLGTVYELVPVPLKLMAKVDRLTGLSLALPNGEFVYGKLATKMLEYHNFKAISCRGKWIASKVPIFRSSSEKLTFIGIADGEVIDAVGYRVKHRSPLRMELDTPPIMSFNPDGYRVGDLSGSIVYKVR